MNIKRNIDDCIELIKAMLSDTNNDLTPKQRSKLKKGIRDLKRLQKATKLTHKEIFSVVSRIAEAAYEVVNNGQSA
jgi:septation ring formation regulator EzrA